MTQKDRRLKRENELKKTIEFVCIRSNGICEHCNQERADDFAHNIRKNRDNYKFFSDPDNIHHWGRICHELYDDMKVKEFAELNDENFHKLMKFLKDNGRTETYENYMRIYNG